MKPIHLLVALTVILGGILIIVRLQPKRDSIPTTWGMTDRDASAMARSIAAKLNGVSFRIAPTGSMEPFITGGDYVVMVKVPYSSVHVGMLAIYQARWRPADAPMVMHWVAAKSWDQWIMDGQHNKTYENTADQLMGEKEFRGSVVAIFTQRKK